ncbi:3-hydroxyacyl-CoA dehydrogenase family protein [Streptomyces sp. NPDC059373]
MSLSIAIVGAGVMGTAIAQVFATAGQPVTVYDPDPVVLTGVEARLRAGTELAGTSAEDALGLLTLAPGLAAAVRDADLVIEAGPERVAVKQAIFRDLDQLTAPGVVLASNTSAIPIGEIARDTRRPERVIGTHFWNPPYLVPLVEVVQARRSDPELIAWTCQVLDEVGMKPVHVVADVPGFVGNRLQHALKREAIALVAAGVCSAETVDTVTRYGFGARLGIVGPLEQSDLSGLELTLAIHEVLMPSLDRTAGPHPLLVEKVRKGETFREWRPGEAEARRAEITRALAEAAARRRNNEPGKDGQR